MAKANEPKIEAFRKDFAALKAELRREGLFTSSPWRVGAQIVAHIALFLLSYSLSFSFPLIAFLLATAASINLVWWIHDCGHDAVIQNRDWSKVAIESLGVIFLGMPQLDYHYEIHRIHHGFTNVLGGDTALETGPVIWSKEMYRENLRSFLPFQGVVWIFFVLPLTYPLITFRCLQMAWSNGDWPRIAFLAGRWLVFPLVFGLSLVHLAGPVLIAGFVLGFTASLNHFSMPITEKSATPFPARVFFVTQNLNDPSRFTTWLTGGLNFHVEHHLFPTMPSWNLHKARKRVRQLAKKHGLPYHSVSKRAAVATLLATLRDPLRPTKLQREFR